MHLIYGMDKCNVREVLWIYREKYPGRNVLSRSFFAILHRRLCETDSFDERKPYVGRQRITLKVDAEETVVQKLQSNPPISTWVVSPATYKSPMHLFKHLLHYTGRRNTSLSFTTSPSIEPRDYSNRMILDGGFCKKLLQIETSQQVLCSRTRLHSR